MSSDYKRLITLDRDSRDLTTDRPDGHVYERLPKNKKPVVTRIPLGRCHRCGTEGAEVCSGCLDALAARAAGGLEVVEYANTGREIREGRAA